MLEIHRRGTETERERERDREIDRESELVLTVAILSRAARSINIPRLHHLYRSTWTGSSKRFSFVCSFAEKKSFRRDYATDTWDGLRVERAAGRREKGDDGEIGFALQSRRSVTMGHSNERKYASAYSLWIIQLHDYPRPPSIGARCAPGGSLNSMSRRFSRRNEISPVVTRFRSVSRSFRDKARWTMGIWKYDLAKE